MKEDRKEKNNVVSRKVERRAVIDSKYMERCKRQHAGRLGENKECTYGESRETPRQTGI